MTVRREGGEGWEEVARSGPCPLAGTRGGRDVNAAGDGDSMLKGQLRSERLGGACFRAGLVESQCARFHV